MRLCPVCQLRYRDGSTQCALDGATLEEARDERLGLLLGGRYLVVAVIGEGGMATVYRALEPATNQLVAVKVLHRRFVSDEAVRERFRREARAVAQLAHPRIVQVYDSGETDDGCPYLVMELLEGQTLEQRIAASPMTLPEVLDVGGMMVEGLARAHDLGVVHRDLKPANVFLCAQPGEPPVVKLVDFGMARVLGDQPVTRAGEVLGTPAYLAPETLRGEAAAPSIDLYALGAVLFEMVAGRPPFVCNSIPMFVVSHLTETPPRLSTLVPSTPAALDALVASLLSKSPQERPVDAHQVLRALRAMSPSQRLPRLRMTSREVRPSATPSVDRWRARADVISKLIDDAFGRGTAPKEVTALSTRIAESTASASRAYARALESQLALATLEDEARESRERLGHAVQALGEDLSQCREGLRAASAEELDAERICNEAQLDYQLAHARVVDDVQEPDRARIDLHRRAAASMERWLTAHHALSHAIDEKAGALGKVGDLEFQIRALRERIARVEEELARRRAIHQAALIEAGLLRTEHEGTLTSLLAELRRALAFRPDVLASLDAGARPD